MALPQSRILRQLHAMPLPEAERNATIIRARGAVATVRVIHGHAGIGTWDRLAGPNSGRVAAIARCLPTRPPRQGMGRA